MMVVSDMTTVVTNYGIAVGAGFLLGAMAGIVGTVVAWGLRLLRTRP